MGHVSTTASAVLWGLLAYLYLLHLLVTESSKDFS